MPRVGACYFRLRISFSRVKESKCLLNAASMFAVKAKIYGVLHNQSSSIAFDETSSYWSEPKKLLIYRLFIGHHTVVWFPLVSIS